MPDLFLSFANLLSKPDGFATSFYDGTLSILYTRVIIITFQSQSLELTIHNP